MQFGEQAIDSTKRFKLGSEVAFGAEKVVLGEFVGSDFEDVSLAESLARSDARLAEQSVTLHTYVFSF